MLLRPGLWFPGGICRWMTQSASSFFLSNSHGCLTMKRNVPRSQDFICIQACVRAFAQSATRPSQQNCGCKRKGSVRLSCRGLVVVSLTSVLDHSDVTGHTEPCCFEWENPAGNCWLDVICTHFFCSLFNVLPFFYADPFFVFRLLLPS